jgi:hypothetical protein
MEDVMQMIRMISQWFVTLVRRIFRRKRLTYRETILAEKPVAVFFFDEEE